jgi:branched-chain amino acid transport system permease protein
MDYVIGIGILFGINIILATSLNVINGFCGLFSLGHAGFFAVGAYSGAAFSVLLYPEFVSQNPNLGLFLASIFGMVMAGIAGLVVGIPCLRLTGDYLAIATVGFGEIIRVFLLNFDAVGGSRGFNGIPPLTNGLWVVGAVVFTLVFLNNIIRSSYGRCIIAIREDEIAAQSMGVNVRYYKTFSFVLGSVFAGLAGSLYGHYQQFLAPSSFAFMISVNVLLMIVLGGIGSQRGAIIGAFIVTVLPELLRFNDFLSEIRTLVFGIIMVVMMLIQPSGLMGLFSKKSGNYFLNENEKKLKSKTLSGVSSP